MLTANVGFLAIPGVIVSNINSSIDKTSSLHIFTSYAQIVSSMSVEASVGSIVIGMLLVRHNRTKQREDPAGAVSSKQPLGLCSWLIALLAVNLPLQEYSPNLRSGADGHYL